MQQVVLSGHQQWTRFIKFENIFFLNFIQILSSPPPLPPPFLLPSTSPGPSFVEFYRAQSPECVLIFGKKNRMCVNYRNQISKVVYIKKLTCSAPSTWVSKRHWGGQSELRMNCRRRLRLVDWFMLKVCNPCRSVSFLGKTTHFG